MSRMMEDAFGGVTDPEVLANKVEDLKDSINKALDDGIKGRVRMNQVPGPDGRLLVRSETPDYSSVIDTELSKSLDADTLASVTAQLTAYRAAQADLGKDITTTSPLTAGLAVPFDLEAPSKKLTPRPAPLRARIPRKKAIGLADRYKRITGFSGTGTGGTTALDPAITESTTNSFGSLSLLRGPKISYAADDTTVNFKQFSVSDRVTQAAQTFGQGFEDLRALSAFALLWSSILSEERMLLLARGTDSVFSGTIPAPTGVTLTVRAAAAGETGNSANIATLFVYVVAFGDAFPTASAGYSAPSTVASTTGMSASTGNVVDVTFTDSTGQPSGYAVFAGTTTGIANAFICTNTDGTKRTGYNKFTINFTGGGTGGTPNSGQQIAVSGDNASAASGHYDGVWTIASGANSGYVTRLNAGFSTSNPGSEYETAFASLYDAVKADPDEVFFNGFDRKQLSDLLKTASSANYRLAITQDEVKGATVGSIVTGIANEVTGKMVDVTVHPWLPQGNSAIVSWTLPIPDTEVENVFEVKGPQDYMGIQWPQIELAYDSSSFWINALLGYAPAWCGAVNGIKKV